MIKDSDGKFNDYSNSPKIRQISLCWGYELTKKLFLCIKMSFTKNKEIIP